jgi:hypothetical protein
MITKGQAAEYYRAIELQKFMHSNLKSHPIFQYIGHPIPDDDWARTFGGRQNLKEKEFYVSGDYKAATDNLRPDLSEWTWECICRSSTFDTGFAGPLPEAYHRLGMKCLTGHSLHYDEAVRRQSWGQLMGSPMSFPILCIVNAAATLVALGQPYRKEFPMRVNGDDIAFIADPETYARWKEVTKLCGLEFSLGKNYTSREFVIMNSELRRSPKDLEWEEVMEETGEKVEVRQTKSVETELWVSNGEVGRSDLSRVLDIREDYSLVSVQKPTLRPKAWKLEGFLNQSLVRGLVKKGMDAGAEKDVFWTDLSSISYEMLRGIPSRDQWKLYGLFFKTYDSAIREAPSMCNKWFPKSLGGMGLCPPEKLEFKTDPEVLLKQRLVAASLACDNIGRLRRPTRGANSFGMIRGLVKDVRGLSDRQIPARLCPKPLHRENKPVMGGQTLLGYLLAAPCLLSPYHKWDSTGSRVLKQYKLGGILPEEAATNHKVVNQRLHSDYERWIRNRVHTSLEPMKLEKCTGYQEHLALLSFVESMQEGTVERRMDSRLGRRCLGPVKRMYEKKILGSRGAVIGHGERVHVPCTGAEYKA